MGNSAIFMRASAIILLVLSAAGCSAGPDREVEEVPPGITFEGFRFRAYRGTALAASGDAAKASFRRDNTDLTAATVAVRVPGKPGEADAWIRGPWGKGNLREGRFEAWGGVTATRASTVATTDKLRWDRADGLIRGDDPVAIRRPGFALDGPGFVLDPAAATVRITGPGTARAGGGAGR